ncbi:MAG: hypothetical protein ACYCXB_01615 [Candidatus Humimicrobiaceae bacterium]
MFDSSKLKLKHLNEREHALALDIMLRLDDEIPEFNHPAIGILSGRIMEVRSHIKSVIIMMGRSGMSIFLIELLKKGLVNHFALNGTGVIHDFELAMIGATIILKRKGSNIK